MFQLSFSQCACVFEYLFFSRVGSHRRENISSAHSVLPGFALAAQLFWESLAETVLEQKMKHKPWPYAPKSAFSFEATGSKLIQSKIYNQIKTHQHVKYTVSTQTLAWMCPNRAVTKCHFKRWSHATFSGITGVLKSSSGAAPVFGWLLGTLHPHVSGECDSIIRTLTLGTVRQSHRHWKECRMTRGFMRRILALLQFRRGEGEVTKLLLVDGRDHRVIDGR